MLEWIKIPIAVGIALGAAYLTVHIVPFIVVACIIWFLVGNNGRDKISEENSKSNAK